MKTLNEHIDSCAQSICDRIASSNTINLEEIKSLIRTEFLMSMEAALRSDFDILVEQSTKLSTELADPRTSKTRRVFINNELANIAAQKRRITRSVTLNSDRMEMEQLKWYVRNKFGDEALQGFYDIIGQKESFRHK